MDAQNLASIDLMDSVLHPDSQQQILPERLGVKALDNHNVSQKLK